MSSLARVAGDVIAGWTDEEIDKLELGFLHDALACRDAQSVDTALAFAAFMRHRGLTSDNYPVFLELVRLPNHWVVEALLGSSDPERYFEAVQPNRFILSSCFRALESYRPGEVYEKALLVVIGILKSSYEQASDGYRIYAPTVSDVNHLAKHLEEEQGQSFPLNQTILHVLDRIASLADPGGAPPSDRQMADIAVQANHIRGKFLDQTKHIREAIPAELLSRGDYRSSEVPPTSAAGKASS